MNHLKIIDNSEDSLEKVASDIEKFTSRLEAFQVEDSFDVSEFLSLSLELASLKGRIKARSDQ